MSTPRMIRCINGHVFDANANNACPNCGWTETANAKRDDSSLNAGPTSESGIAPVSPNPNRNLMYAVVAFAVIGLGVATYALLKPVPVPDPIVKVPDKVAEKTPEKATENKTEKLPDKVSEKAPEKVIEPQPVPVPDPITKTPDKAVEKTPEKAIENKPEVLPDKVPDKDAEKPPEKATEKVVQPQPDPQPPVKVVPPVPPKTTGLPAFEVLKPVMQDAQMAAAASLGLSPFATETALVTRATTLAEHYPVQLDALRMLVPFVNKNQPQALEVAGDAIHNGNDVAVNDQIALDYLTRSANQGATRARVELGEILRLGRGTPRDEKAGFALHILVSRADSKMSEQIIPLIAALKIKVEGNGPTAFDLQKAYESSNWVQSLKLARELADVQIAKGYHVLGLLSWEGNAVPKDQAAAIDWWKKATTIGYSPASESLSLAAKSPPSGTGNLVEAMVWLEIGFLQAENHDRAIYFTDKISEQAGLLDRKQWSIIKTLFADIQIPGPG